jgi:hypothetical protein
MSESILNEQLTAMADDPNIQRELQKIEQDFACTESDGLDQTCAL